MGWMVWRKTKEIISTFWNLTTRKTGAEIIE
jgi:hypothetical protein